MIINYPDIIEKKSSISNIFNEIIKPRFLICQDYDMLLKNEIRGDLYIYVRKILIQLLIATVIISLISIKSISIGNWALYLPIIFKVIKLQLNLSKGLIDDVNAQNIH